MPTTTASSSSKAPSSIGALVLVKSSKPKIGQPSVRPDPPALQYPCDTLTGCENASCRWRLRRQDLGHAAPCFSVLLEVSGRFEEILLGYALSSLILGRARALKILSSALLRRVGTTRPTTAPPFRLTETVSFAGSLRPSRTSWRRIISISTVSLTKRPTSRKKIPLS